MKACARVVLPVVMVGVLASNCTGYMPHTTVVPAPRDPLIANVYEAVIAHAFEGSVPRIVYVSSTSDQVRDLRGLNKPSEIDVPPELAARLEAVSRLPISPDSLGLPAGTRVWHEPQAPDPDAANGEPSPLLTFSPVALSQDADTALVYYEFHCGALCGYGDVVLLTRAVDGHWQVRRTWRLMVT